MFISAMHFPAVTGQTQTVVRERPSTQEIRKIAEPLGIATHDRLVIGRNHSAAPQRH